MLVRMKVAAYRLKSRKKPLALPWRFKATHSPFSYPRGTMRVLRSIVQTLVVPMFDAWNQFLLSGPIASEFVGDDDSGGETSRFQQFAEEFLRRAFIAMTLHQDVEDLTVGIHRSPEVIRLPLNGDHNLVKMPLVSRLGATATNLINVSSMLENSWREGFKFLGSQV